MMKDMKEIIGFSVAKNVENATMSNSNLAVPKAVMDAGMTKHLAEKMVLPKVKKL